MRVWSDDQTGGKLKCEWSVEKQIQHVRSGQEYGYGRWKLVLDHQNGEHGPTIWMEGFQLFPMMYDEIS